MKPEENQPDNETLSKQRKRAINQLVYGSIILLWGSLLTLKQFGIIEKNVSTWPYPLTVFGIALVGAGIYKLSTSRRL